MHFTKLLEELKERRLYRVAVLYTAIAWLALQIADIVAQSFEWPQWLMQGLIFATIVGFPAVILTFWFLGEPAPDGESDNDTPSSPGVSREKPFLVVLPFECFSDKVEDLYATYSLTEDITTLLSRFSDYSVIARNSAFAYKDKRVDVRDLKRELGARYALQGSVRLLTDSVRVTIQLTESDNGANLWAEQFLRPTKKIEEVHDDICREIVLKLGHELTRAEINLARLKPPAEWGAWELYQEARGALQFAGWSKKSFENVANLLRQAIEKDPYFAPAQAYFSLILALGHWSYLYPDREATYSASLAAGQRAMALAPESSEVLGYVGCALSDLGQPEKGIPIIERAIELNPSNSQAFAALGAAKVVSGRMEEGIRDLRHAVTLSPVDPGLAPWSTILSFAETHMGNNEASLAWAKRACQSDPSYFGGYLALAMAQKKMGQGQEARRSLQTAQELNPDLSQEAVESLIGAEAWREFSTGGIHLPSSAPQSSMRD